MLKNDIERTLQAHKPEPSEGFAEMIDDKVLHLMAERQEQKAARKKKRLRLVPVTAAALVVVMCAGILAANGHFGLINRPDEILPGEGRYTVQPIETVLAQGTVPGETEGVETSKAADDLESEHLKAKMDNELSEIKEKLVPLNLSCEDQGIRMEVKAAAAEGCESWILYSLEFKRDDLDLHEEYLQFPSAEWNNGKQIQTKVGKVAEKEGNKTTFLMHTEYAEPVLPKNGMVRFTLDNIRFIECKDVDLTEIITEYADVSEGITPPEPVIDNNLWSEMKHGKRIILDNSHPLDIPLWEDVVLTGTGWINGELHIQLHYTEHADRFHFAMLRQYDTESPYNETDKYPFILDYYEQMWDGDGDGVVDGTEFTLDLKDDMDQRKIILQLEKTVKAVEGNWTVEFPLNSIRAAGNCFEQDGLVFSLEGDDSIMVVSDPSYQERKEITIPEIAMAYVRKIGEDAFKDCRELNTLTIPDYVSEIRDHAFSGCENLATLNLPKELGTIGKGAFEGCKALTSIDLPENVMTIGGSAFRGCSSLASITIPDGAVFEGGYVFADCESMVSVTLPLRMENLEDYMFSGCKNLEMVFIQNGTRTIGRGAFRNCGKLKLVEIPNSVYYITDYAFEGCGSLKKIEIPENVSYIGKNAFTGCENLVCAVYEGSYAQQYCEENGIQYEIRQTE